MEKPIVARDFSRAACDVLDIDYIKHAVIGVDVKTENGGIVEIHVRFAVPYGLLNSIEIAMKADKTAVAAG